MLNFPESTMMEANILGRTKIYAQNAISLFSKYVGVNVHVTNVTEIVKQTGRPAKCQQNRIEKT